MEQTDLKMAGDVESSHVEDSRVMDKKLEQKLVCRPLSSIFVPSRLTLIPTKARPED